ncbi:hypothetical protein C0995_015223 [Termitomyces sp. Mi166|nr:hypothetical protein C0995_015223 [Termitomyces sp. Mi166\
MDIRMQKKHSSVEVLELVKHIKMVKAAKAFLECQGKQSGFFVVEGLKTKGKSKVIAAEKTGAKHAFKFKETVNSNSNKDDKEERVHVIKKIKCKHVKEPVGKGKRKGKKKGKEVEKTQMTISNSGNGGSKGAYTERSDGDNDEEEGDEDDEGEMVEDEGTGLVIDADFLELLCLEEALQRTMMEVAKAIESMESVSVS